MNQASTFLSVVPVLPAAGPADAQAVGGAVLQHAGEHLRLGAGDLGREHSLSGRVVAEQHLAARTDDLRHELRGWSTPSAAITEYACAISSGCTPLVPSVVETTGGSPKCEVSIPICAAMRLDPASPVAAVVAGPHRELGAHERAVVGLRDRLRQRGVAAVAVAGEVVERVAPGPGPEPPVERARVDPVIGRVSGGERGRERDGLERRARLAARAVDRGIELARVYPRPNGHRAHGAVAVVDRDECRRELALVLRDRAGDREVCGELHHRVVVRVDPEARPGTAACAPRPWSCRARSPDSRGPSDRGARAG